MSSAYFGSERLVDFPINWKSILVECHQSIDKNLSRRILKKIRTRDFGGNFIIFEVSWSFHGRFPCIFDPLIEITSAITNKLAYGSL